MYKKIIEGKKAVLFDMDGTLLQSEEVWAESKNRVADANNISTSQFRHFVHGTSMPEKWKNLVKTEKLSLDPNTLAEQTHVEFLKIAKENPPLVTEGFWALAVEFKEYKGLKLGLTTNTYHAVTDELLKLYGLQNNVFEFIICGDDVKHVKPHPEMYKLAIKKLSMGKKEILVFEDSVAGSTASHKAGLDTVVIWNGDVPEREYPNDMLGFITDFTPLVGNLDTTLPEIVDAHVKSLNEKLSKMDLDNIPQQSAPPAEQPEQS